MGGSIHLYMLMKEMLPLSSLWCWYCHLHAHLLLMAITLCNFHPFTYFLSFHTSPPVDQWPIHAPSICTVGLDSRARHSHLGARILTTLTFSTHPAALRSYDTLRNLSLIFLKFCIRKEHSTVILKTT